MSQYHWAGLIKSPAFTICCTNLHIPVAVNINVERVYRGDEFPSFLLLLLHKLLCKLRIKIPLETGLVQRGLERDENVMPELFSLTG